MISRREFLKGGVAAVAISAIAVSTGAKAEALGIPQDLPRPFLNKLEFTTWLKGYGRRGGADCEHLALELFHDAYKDGYLVWPIAVYNQRIAGEKVVPRSFGKRHFGNWTWAGNYLYYVDLALSPPFYKRIKDFWLD